SPLLSISLYALSFWIMRNHLNASLSTIIGLLVTEHGLVPNLQVLYPSSVIMSIFPMLFLIVYSILRQTNLGKVPKIILISIPLFALLLIHFQMGMLASIFILI